MSSNSDSLGTDDHVYRQIATELESYHIGRKDENILKFLLKNHDRSENGRTGLKTKNIS